MAGESAPRGFEDFVKAYADRAFGFAYRFCGNVEDAQEYVQESFLRALRHWDTLGREDSLESWYFSVLRNVAADAHRRVERRREVPLDPTPSGCGEHSLADVVAEGGVTALDALEGRERDRAVRDALDALPPEQRRVLVLVDMEGRSYEQIARVLSVPLGTVRSRVSRAREAFRKALAPNFEVNL